MANEITQTLDLDLDMDLVLGSFPGRGADVLEAVLNAVTDGNAPGDHRA